MTPSCHPVTDGSPEAQRGADMGRGHMARRVLLCRRQPGPDSFIHLASPTVPRWPLSSICTEQAQERFFDDEEQLSS